MKKIILILGLLLFLWGCGEESSLPLKPKLVQGKVFTLEQSKVLWGQSYPGQIEAREKVFLKALSAGKISGFAKEEGEWIEKGELIVEIDTTFLQKELKLLAAEIRSLKEEYNIALSKFKQAERDYNRYVTLFQKKVISKQELEKRELEKEVLEKSLDSIQAKLDGLLAKRESLEHQLTYSQLKSPVSGYLFKKLVDRGSIVSVGQDLAEIYEKEKLCFFTQIESKFFEKIKKSDRFLVYFPALTKSLFLPVWEKVPYSSFASQTFTLRLKVKENLLPGTYGEMFLPLGEKKALLLPLKVIGKRGGLNYVYVLDEKNILHYRLLALGDTYGQQGENFLASAEGEWVEVLSGLEAGERVFLETEKAEEGALVDVQS
ncbi:MAG: Efflux transporter, RND family, MFP subunit [Desulfonauticus sp. 38_4375]|jgi:RND family efflux transporter MFP subunit|nr:MAG: Efflux transporter, RND family, MFP subunit [Desulfonauticus sp. 38_4375]